MATAKPELSVKTEPAPGTSSSASPSSTAPAINDSNLTPSPFHGTEQENAQDWLNYFCRYVQFKQQPEPASLALFSLLMRGTADMWLSSLPEETRNSYADVLDSFKEKYAPAPISLWRRASELWSRDQKPHESVEEFFYHMLCKARDVQASDEMTRYAIMRGLKPELRKYVMRQNPTTNAALLEAAKIAEATFVETAPPVSSEVLEAINRLEQRMFVSIGDGDTRRVTFGRSPSPAYPRTSSAPRRDVRRNGSEATGGLQFHRQSRPRDRSGNQPTGNNMGPPMLLRRMVLRGPMGPQHPPPREQLPSTSSTSGCTNCGRIHAFGNCIAKGKLCRYCGKPNHFAVCCRSKPQRE